jgi:ubiquinone/menaquinone biosynthesis C-methylase UbiE
MSTASVGTSVPPRKVNLDELIPPDSMNFVGGANFKGVGEQFFGYFVDLAGLKPNERVLDVGCGIGRMALPLTQYLNEQGSYEGFDIVKMGIDWCQQKITPLFPNFKFQLADIYNKHYNPTGPIQSPDYKFPYPDRSFDFVFLTSVFTHMLPAEVANYLAEISRVLKWGGRCLITFFLLNAESRNLVLRKKSTLDFSYPFGGCFVASPDVPELAISYDEGLVRRMFRANGFKLVGPVHYGHWCERKEHLSYQDIIVATKDRWAAVKARLASVLPFRSAA